ncbi:MAG: cytidylate kinase family protein [Patescibacteria group bacterium]|nr:cytidylate kinase family protein [Patescibacteria group bacterium]
MIISFNGDEGSGKSTIAKKVAEELGYPRYYMGQIFRDMAKKGGLPVAEYAKLSKKDASADKEVDDYILKLAKEKKDFVIESRTAWHFVPDSLKIYLRVSDEEGAKRIFKQLQEESGSRNEDKKTDSVADVLKSIHKRRKADDIRYKKFYGINVRDPKNYDFILNTTNLTREEVFEKVMELITSRIN